MATLDEWTARAAGALDLDQGLLDQALILDLARQVAHSVARPAAPVTAYLVGVAVGRGMDAALAASAIAELAASWPAPDEGPA